MGQVSGRYLIVDFVNRLYQRGGGTRVGDQGDRGRGRGNEIGGPGVRGRGPGGRGRGLSRVVLHTAL